MPVLSQALFQVPAIKRQKLPALMELIYQGKEIGTEINVMLNKSTSKKESEQRAGACYHFTQIKKGSSRHLRKSLKAVKDPVLQLLSGKECFNAKYKVLRQKYAWYVQEKKVQVAAVESAWGRKEVEATSLAAYRQYEVFECFEQKSDMI